MEVIEDELKKNGVPVDRETISEHIHYILDNYRDTYNDSVNLLRLSSKEESSHVPEDHPRSHAPTLAKPPKHAPKCQNPRANPAANSAKEHGPRKRRLTL